MKPFRTVSWQAVGCATSLLFSHISMSQPEENSNSERLIIEEIVITAEKREQSLNDVGLAVTALSGDSLAEKGINSVEDLVKVVPGFNAAPTPYGSPVYSLRGVGFYDNALAGTPAVTVYVDEVPLPYPVMAAGVNLDLERVEILKGPQGILFGQNSTGGAINYIAAKPTEHFEAGLTLSLGRFNMIDTEGYVSGSLTETLTARFSGSVEHRGDWQESYTRNDSHGARDFSTARVLFDWQPDEKLSALFGASGWRDQSDSPVGQYVRYNPQIPSLASEELANYPIAPRGDIRAADWSPGQSWDRNNHFLQVWSRIDYELTEDLSLTSITSYADYDREEFADTDGIALSVTNRQPEGWIKAFNQEIRVANSPVAILRWVVGANVSYDRAEEDVVSDYSEASPASAVGQQTNGIAVYAKQEFESYAAFGNVEYDLLDDVTLKVGARYTDTARDFEGCGADPGDGSTAAGFAALWSNLKGSPVTILEGGCITLVEPDEYIPGMVRRSLNQDNVAWRTGIDWRATEDTLLYFNVSKGYKAGAFPTVAATTTLQTVPVSQESVLSYEGGIKASMFQDRMSLNASAFYYDYRDKQILGRVAVPIFRSLDALVSVPKSSVVGQELSIVAIPARGFEVSLSAVHVDAKIDKYTGISDFGDTVSFDGTSTPLTPEWQIAAGIEYTRMVSDSLEFFVAGDLRYQDETNSLPGEDANYEIDSYTIADVRIGVTDIERDWQLTIWGRNVTNEYYATNIQRQTDTVVRFLGMPATYGLTLTMSYD